MEPPIPPVPRSPAPSWLQVSTGAWNRLVTSLVPEALRGDTASASRAHLAIAIVILLQVPLTIRVIQFLLGGPVWHGAVVLFANALAWASLLVLRRTGSLVGLGHSLTLLVFCAASSAAYMRGGLGSPPLIALGIVPLVATFLTGIRGGVCWTGVVCCEVLAFAVARERGWSVFDHFPRHARFSLELVGALFFPLFVLGMSVAYEVVKEAALRDKSRAQVAHTQAEAEIALVRADRMASIGQLAAGVAHEANNPLAYVTANLTYIEQQLRELTSEALDAARPELALAATDAREGAERIARIVRDLKTFARPEQTDELEWLDLRDVLEAALKMARNEIAHRAELVRNYEDVGLVRAPETRLVQVFLNLVLNAAQAIPEGRAHENTISISLQRIDLERARVTISDTGGGISPENLRRITDPFFTTKPVGVGTGLGLSVVKNIVEGLRGELTFESAPGTGTRVHVTLPAPQVFLASQIVRSHTQPVALPRLRILAVDDDRLVVKALARLLREHDFAVETSGRAALDRLSGDPSFDVVLCDLMMPELTGMEVHETLLARAPDLARRMVFLTGGAFTERTREFLESVPNRRLEKPIDLARLNEAMLAVVRGASGGEHDHEPDAMKAV